MRDKLAESKACNINDSNTRNTCSDDECGDVKFQFKQKGNDSSNDNTNDPGKSARIGSPEPEKLGY